MAQVQAAVARRANRRILMRQVGDRLIPVGVTSGRVQVIQGPGAILGDGTGALLVPDASGLQIQGQGDDTQGRRNGRNRTQSRNQDLSQLLGGLSLGGPDLEEVRSASLDFDAGASLSLLVCERVLTAMMTHSLSLNNNNNSSWSWRQCGSRCSRRMSARSANATPQPVQATTPLLPTAARPAGAPAPRCQHLHLPSAPHRHALRTPSRDHRGGSRELSPAAVHNLTSSALGRAALSGALAIGLPLPRSGPTPPPQQQQQPVADSAPAPAHASASSSPVAHASEQLLISVPVAALVDAIPSPTEQAAVATAEPLPTPSANIDAEINKQLQAPLEPQTATTTTSGATSVPPQTSAKGKERAHDDDEAAPDTHTHTEPV